ncbi:MAG TPA: DUF255 domain-containing protein [Candidatus Acidoferrales bacterium]|nr:DUF255 domain-containing protein [Candidatus Acidoferrales bacterium]
MAAFRFSPRPNRANEIEWREWGDAAFAEAKRRDVPVLLAISAVWCHWCHVMDETSYSVPEIIEAINARYVPVRVDNDARPDVNRRYNMGGWPTTAFLTPDGEIVHGATYVPPEQMFQTVVAVADVWQEKKEDIRRRIAEAAEKESAARKPRDGSLTREIPDIVRALISGQYDPQYGGFGREPKFPQVKVVRFLLDEHRRSAAPELATMLRTTLDAMAAHGMYDHVEGGFFRYATQRDWNVPHYEKMLEDNAELLAIYAEAHLVFPDAGYDRVVRDVIRWMDATLFQQEVGLWSGSQDADEHYYTLDATGRRGHDAPFVDRTLYTSWNALAAFGYLRAGEALGDASLRERAASAARAIDHRMRDGQGRLCRSDDGSGPKLPDLLEDAATYLRLLIALGDGVGAVAVATRMREALEDTTHGGFFDTPGGDAQGRLARRERPIEENASAADALLALATLVEDDAWRELALRTLRSFVGEYRQWGQFAASYANAVARALPEPTRVVIVGPAGDASAEALWRAADDPDAVRLRLDPARDAARIAEQGFPPERIAAYVCVGKTCSAPLADEGSLRRELSAARDAVRI